MSELFVQMSISLDGFIEDSNGGLDWFAGDPTFDRILTRTVQSIAGMIFGRKAYEMGAEYWPNAGESEDIDATTAEQVRQMNALPKYVLTHREVGSGWANSHPIRAEDIARLKREAARPIALFAGAAAAQTAIARGVVDELRLIQFPVLLGSGTPLFAADGQRHDLELVASEAFASGATLRTYALTAG